MLPHLKIPSSSAAALKNRTTTCIFLHGLGDSGHGWAEEMQQLAQQLPFVKFILPHAPKRRVTLNGGALMPAWYDLLGLQEKDAQDSAGILQSAAAVLELVAEEEKQGVSRDRIVIGGFSQGGAVALAVGLLASHIAGGHATAMPFAGILALSTYLPIHDVFLRVKGAQQLAAETPIYMAHGTADHIIEHRWGERSVQFMRDQLGCSHVTFESFPRMAHSVCEAELKAVTQFLYKTLQPVQSASSKNEL